MGKGGRVPANVRRPSAVLLTTVLSGQQNQRSQLQVCSTTNTARRTKRPGVFVSIENVYAF